MADVAGERSGRHRARVQSAAQLRASARGSGTCLKPEPVTRQRPRARSCTSIQRCHSRRTTGAPSQAPARSDSATRDRPKSARPWAYRSRMPCPAAPDSSNASSEAPTPVPGPSQAQWPASRKPAQPSRAGAPTSANAPPGNEPMGRQA